jgi:mRNA interferase HigB
MCSHNENYKGSCLRVISTGRIREYCDAHPVARTALLSFLKIAKAARWTDIIDLRQTYPHADAVIVKSKRTVTVINIRRNEFRLVIAVHYNTRKVFILRFMTHAIYSRGTCKDTL